MKPALPEPTPPQPSAGTDPAPGEDAVERLVRLWQQGQRPEVDAFLAAAGPLPPDEVAAVLRADQRERWRAGERNFAEAYLERFPAVRTSAEAAIDLIYAEFLLREGLGERPTAEEYRRRFPDYADVLAEQIDLHRAMAADPAAETQTAARPGAPPDSTFSPVAKPGAPSAPLPEQFGRYRIVRKLGQGGMAAVYLADDTQLGRPVALKVPKFGRDDDAVVVGRFQREARIAATLHHPNLCPVHDVGQVNGVHYLTMPVIDGEPLSARLERDGPLPQEVAARLVLRIAEAVAVAHEAGVVHRDLKPSNVMLRGDGAPVVMDFGLARRTAVDVRLTASGALVGTPAYCAPEQIGGAADTQGPVGDVYSLGVILYECLTGRPPFEGSLSEVLRCVLTEDPEPPSRRRPGLDPRLEAVCLTALAKAPGARYPSMAAFARTLEAYLRGEAPPRRRHRRGWIVGVGAAVVLLAVVGLAGFWLLRGSPTPVPDALPAGSVWTGTFQFIKGYDHAGPVEVRITDREGDHFRGKYNAEESKFIWLIAGTAHAGEVQWEFTEALHEEGEPDVVGKAVVAGRYDAQVLDALFDHEKSDGSKATLKLRRTK